MLTATLATAYLATGLGLNHLRSGFVCGTLVQDLADRAVWAVGWPWLMRLGRR